MDRADIKKALKDPHKWGEKYSLWATYFCTGCGIMEIPPVLTARWDSERFGVKPMATPRQSNLFLITGYVSIKTLRAILVSYEQMPDPKYVVGFGSCPVDGGLYYTSYNTVNHLDRYLPVDGWIAGCMPRPEAIFIAVTKLWKMIDGDMVDGYKRYKENLEYYRNNQQRVLGKEFVDRLPYQVPVKP